MKKYIITIPLLAAAIALSYGTPAVKHKNPKIIGSLGIPQAVQGWESEDISDEINLTDEKYNFISNIFARLYSDHYGNNVLFLVLDAGNFHNPKVCFGSAGYKTVELPETELRIAGRPLKAQTVFFEKPDGEGYLVLYWLCINKKPVDWAQQKLIQLRNSILNKRETSLMIRIDVPAEKNSIQDSIETSRDFLSVISSKISPDQADYIFGKP